MVMRADVMASCINDGVLPSYQSRDEFLVIYPNPKGKFIKTMRQKVSLKFLSIRILFLSAVGMKELMSGS